MPTGANLTGPLRESLGEMRDLHAPPQRGAERSVSRTLDRPSELANIISYAGKR